MCVFATPKKRIFRRVDCILSDKPRNKNLTFLIDYSIIQCNHPSGKMAQPESMWTRFKKAANEGIATTIRETEKAKSIVMIESLKMKIKGQKQRFGVEVFDLMESDPDKVKEIYEKYKKQVERYREQIEERQTLIQGLTRQKKAYVDVQPSKNESKTTLPIPRTGSVDDAIATAPAVPVKVEVTTEGDGV